MEAEKVKGNLASAKGKSPDSFEETVKQLYHLRKTEDNDDDFFHVTCHIEQNLKEKIENGEFIELERLLSRDASYRLHEEKRVELVSKGGSTFFAPVQDRESQISGIKRWDQAFRV